MRSVLIRLPVFLLIFALSGCATEPRDVAREPHVRIPAGQRVAVTLSAEEREYVLNEMRFFLDLVYVSTEALSRGDMGTVAAAARRRGTAELAGVPPALYDRMPGAFRDGIRETREKIDQIALEAESTGGAQPVLRRVSQLLYLCNACHGMYQLRVSPAAGRAKG